MQRKLGEAVAGRRGREKRVGSVCVCVCVCVREGREFGGEGAADAPAHLNIGE